MEKWKYRYSFFGGVLFLFAFFSKEIIKNFDTSFSLNIVMSSFVLMIIYNAILLLGFIKYSMLNKKYPLLISSILVIASTTLSIFVEMSSLQVAHESETLFYIIAKNFLSLSFILFAISLFLRKKIYGKGTMIAAALCFLYAFSYIVEFSNVVGIIRLGIFLLTYVSLTYVIKKNPKKMQKKELKPRFLRDRFN